MALRRSRPPKTRYWAVETGMKIWSSGRIHAASPFSSRTPMTSKGTPRIWIVSPTRTAAGVSPRLSGTL